MPLLVPSSLAASLSLFPLLSHAGCPGVVLAPWIILGLASAPRGIQEGRGGVTPLYPIFLASCELGGTGRSVGDTCSAPTLSSLHGTATSPGTTACSRRRCTTSGGCASSSACPPTPSIPPSGARRRWVPLDCGIDRRVRYSYGCGMKPPSLLHLTKPLLLSLSSWASTWTGRCTPWWCTRWWMKERVRRGFLAGLGLPSCWHHGASPCTNQAEPPASPCCCQGSARPLSPACPLVFCRAHWALPRAAGHL